MYENIRQLSNLQGKKKLVILRLPLIIHFYFFFQQHFTETRSVTLEAITAKAHFNCPNTNRGCAVRLPLELLKWHKQRCRYQTGDCFMGKVWGNCDWNGCEIDWMNHCMEFHENKIWMDPIVTTNWNYKENDIKKPVKGYFIFKVFGETFNLYHIYNSPATKVLWTVICASKEPKINQRFAYEIEIFSPTDNMRLMTQRNGCHAEKDTDILLDGRCVTYAMSDLLRFMDKDKV